jgi:hypothetical protein
MEDPVHAVIKEIVGVQPWRIVYRVARHQNEFREKGEVDADVYVGQTDSDSHLGFGC